MSEESDNKNTDNKNCRIENCEKHFKNCGSLKKPTGVPGIAL
jgi:hypothetical protein